MMKLDTQLIYHIRLKNFLSYGNDETSLELRPLNVIIGANGSGKSNFLEAIRLLRLAPSPSGLLTAIKNAGGIEEILWKGGKEGDYAEIEIVTISPTRAKLEKGIGLLYRIKFTNELGYFKLIEETIEEVSLAEPFAKTSYSNGNGHTNGNGHKTANGNGNGHTNGNGNGHTNGNGNGNGHGKELHYHFQEGVPTLSYKGLTVAGEKERRIRQVSMFRPTQTALSELKDPETYPEISFLGSRFNQIAIFRGWKFTPGFAPRMPSMLQQKSDFLNESGRNLPLVIRELMKIPAVKTKIINEMRRFYEDFEDFQVREEGSTVQLFIKERHFNKLISAHRLSDGMLRYLCMLTVLCHPHPPALVCLEEPEVGLHPEMITILTELLLEASQRTQLIVTTHSESLISALSVMPEALITCEKHETGTKLRRVNVGKVYELMSKHSLGKIWRLGSIGGTRKIW